MKFSDQILAVAYDHVAKLLDTLKNGKELNDIAVLNTERVYLYQSVLNDYRIRCITFNRIDFFYNKIQYQKEMDSISIEVQITGGMMEQNVILYHVNGIIDSVVKHFQGKEGEIKPYYNIGFIGVDLRSKQLFITDIENRYCCRYQIVIDRDLNQLYNGKRFSYFLRFRYVSCEEE